MKIIKIIENKSYNIIQMTLYYLAIIENNKVYGKLISIPEMDSAIFWSLDLCICMCWQYTSVLFNEN